MKALVGPIAEQIMLLPFMNCLLVLFWRFMNPTAYNFGQNEHFGNNISNLSWSPYIKVIP